MKHFRLEDCVSRSNRPRLANVQLVPLLDLRGHKTKFYSSGPIHSMNKLAPFNLERCLQISLKSSMIEAAFADFTAAAPNCAETIGRVSLKYQR
jgi:hypothetical protein